MSPQEEEQVRLKRQGSKQAIALAMEGRWREAVAANKNLINSFPNDTDAYNRLGRAYMKLGEYSQAKEAYSQAVKLDPYNAIAKKNLYRLSHLGEAMVGSSEDSHKVEPQHFIQETGKAEVVNLRHLAPEEILSKMMAGDRACLKIDRSSLIIENDRGEYLGQVEPKLGQRLIRLMAGGNKYTATVINSLENRLTVIIKEVYQDPSQAGKLSFPAKEFKAPRPYAGDSAFRHTLEDKEGEEEPGYTIVGGGEREVFLKESADNNNETDNKE